MPALHEDQRGTPPDARRLLTECRRAFRALHGLDGAGAPAPEAAVVFAAARRHRVVSLLHSLGGDYAAPAWTSAAYGQALFTARHAAEAERLFARLDAVLDVPLLIKGPALAAQAWPAPGLRAYDDLDWRCAPADYPAFDAELRAAGYAPEIAEADRRAHYWHYGWGIAYRHPDGFRVEANHRLFPPPWPWPAHLRGARPGLSAACRLDAADVRAPTPAFHLLLACAHALWHGGERLAWAADIAGLLVRHPEAWPQAEALAGPRGFPRAALRAGCRIAEDLFGPGLWPGGAADRGTDAVERRYRAQLEKDRGVSLAEARLLHYPLMSPPERVGSALRRWLTPGDGDFRRFTLPRRARALYWLLRPLRALRR